MNWRPIRVSFRLWTWASSIACDQKVMSSMTHFRNCFEIVHNVVAKGVLVSLLDTSVASLFMPHRPRGTVRALYEPYLSGN